MIIQRDLIDKIKPFLIRDEFISIIGPRQSGKTTLLNMLEKYLVEKLKVKEELIKNITFENRKMLMEFETDPISFIRSFIIPNKNEKLFMMIDEFQYAEDDGQKLKLIYDTVKGIKIIITGSSSLDIKAKVGKFMVGRMLNFHLYPFNFREYLKTHNERLERVYIENNNKVIGYIINGKQFKNKSGKDLLHDEFIEEYENFAIWGGYPAPVLTKNETTKRKLLSDIYNNYILKDIKTLLELATEKNLFLLSQYLAAQIGNIVVYQNLSQASGLEYRKLKKHLNILDETFICREIKPFFKNRQKELSKNPKIYFLDMGFRNNFMENMNGFNKRPDAGAIIENLCFIRLNELHEGLDKINFWRTKAGAEVDFVLNKGGNIMPVEIKYSEFKEDKLSKSFMSFIDSFEPKQAAVLTKNYWGSVKKGKTRVLFIPIYYL